MVRFSADESHVWCALDDGPLQQLDADSGETREELLGVRSIRDSPYSSHVWMDCINAGFVVEGPTKFRFARLTFYAMDAVFGQDELCLSEAAGPVRCFCCRTGRERWRFEPAEGTHVVRLCYRQSDRCFYGVQLHGDSNWRFLVRFSEAGARVKICRLSSWNIRP